MGNITIKKLNGGSVVLSSPEEVIQAFYTLLDNTVSSRPDYLSSIFNEDGLPVSIYKLAPLHRIKIKIHNYTHQDGLYEVFRVKSGRSKNKGTAGYCNRVDLVGGYVWLTLFKEEGDLHHTSIRYSMKSVYSLGYVTRFSYRTMRGPLSYERMLKGLTLYQNQKEEFKGFTQEVVEMPSEIPEYPFPLLDPTLADKPQEPLKNE